MTRSTHHHSEPRLGSRRAATAILLFAAFGVARGEAQEVADPGFRSVGRGAALAVALQAPPRESMPAGTPAAELARVRAQMQRYPFVGPMRIPLIRGNQASAIVSLLTPEYQKRAVQNLYHQGNSAAPEWSAQYCWPEGFMRRWYFLATGVQPHYLLATPKFAQIRTGVARNFITDINVGRQFRMDGSVPRLGPDVARWYGETMLDLFRRPWGQLWEKYFEQGMEKPGTDEGIFEFGK